MPNRIILFFIFMAIFSASFQIGSLLEISVEDATTLMEEFKELTMGIDGLGIFLHNGLIALVMFLPGFGVAWGINSAVITGYAFAAIVVLAPELEHVQPLALLYLSPFGIMELVSYSIATSRSYILIWAIIKKTGLYQHVWFTLIEIGIVLVLLLAGGFLEYYMIGLIEREEFVLPGFEKPIDI